MAEPRRLIAEIHIDGGSISGFLIAHGGRRRRSSGWLELISAVQATEEPDPSKRQERAGDET